MTASAIRLPLTIALAALLAVGISGCSAEAKRKRLLTRAEHHFKAGDYEKARIDYLAVLRADSTNLVALQRMGIIWSEQGAAIPALPFLLKARDLNQSDAVTRRKLAAALLYIGEWPEARKEAMALLQEGPGDGEALRLLVEISFQPSDLAEAQRALESFPEKGAVDFYLASATLALHRNDLSTAETEIRRALEIDPNSSLGHVAAGYLANIRKDFPRARNELKAGADLSPPRSSARLKYAEFLITAGATAEAKGSLEALVAKAPDYLPAWRLLAQIFALEKNFGAALAHLEKVFSRDPEDLDGRVLQSNILLAQGERSRAMEIIERLDGVYHGRIPAVKLQLARVASANGNTPVAEAALSQALAANPNYAEAGIALAELKIQNGEPSAAIQPMMDLLRQRPDLQQPRLVLAAAYQASGQAEPAVALLQEQLHAWPSDLRAHLLLATIFRQQNKLAQARSELEAALQISPDQIPIFAQVIDLDLAEKNFPTALQRLRDRIHAQPGSAELRYLEGKVLFAQREMGAAEAALKKALELDANQSAADELLVAIYFETGRVVEAVHQAEGIAARQPENLQALMSLGLLKEKTQDFAGAAEVYERLLSRSEAHVPALNNLAYLYAERLGQSGRAVDLARKARDAQPTDPAVADTLGWALFKQKEYAQALPLLQESAEKLASLPDPQFHLGMAFYMMGQPEPAKEAFEKALEVGDFTGKPEAQRRLARLKNEGGKNAPSTSVLEKLAVEDSADVLNWIQLGNAYEAANNLSKAADAYEAARQVNPNLLVANLKLAQLNAAFFDRPDKALELAKKARELAPNDPAVVATLGQIVFESGNDHWAYGLLQDATRDQVPDVSVLRNLAWVAYRLGKVGEAEEAMRKVTAIAAASNSSEKKEAEQFLAFAALELNPEAASASERKIKSTLSEQPDYVPALMARAAIEMAKDDSAQAANTLEGILRRYPDFAPAQRDLAAVYNQSPGSLEKANDLARRARQSLPDDPRLTRILGEISFKRSDFAYAAQLFLESGRDAPLDAGGLYQLGISELEIGQAESALGHLQSAIKAGLDGQLVAEAERRIAAHRN